MPKRFDPRLDLLPDAQKEIWAGLAAAPRLSFVLYGGTAIALQLGHRQSVDFDFFRAGPLNKQEIRRAFAFLENSTVLQDIPDSLIALAQMPSGSVKVSFFGGIRFGRVNAPLQTRDGTLLVASLDDLMATKLKTILDRAEVKDYRDIAKMISAGVSLSAGLAAFRQMFNGEPSQVLRAIGYFKDGDLPTLDKVDQELLRNARDQVDELPVIHIVTGELAVEAGMCGEGSPPR
jgi:Nucleotidyl transferase AbiEii toxin, Type IV TA system